MPRAYASMEASVKGSSKALSKGSFRLDALPSRYAARIWRALAILPGLNELNLLTKPLQVCRAHMASAKGGDDFRQYLYFCASMLTFADVCCDVCFDVC